MPQKDRDEYNAYMRDYMLRRYHQRMNEARQKLGGQCVVCGTDEELELDHIDPTTKSFTIGKMWSVSKSRFDTELDKCQLLCNDHHIAKTVANGDNNKRLPL